MQKCLYILYEMFEPFENQIWQEWCYNQWCNARLEWSDMSIRKLLIQ